MTNFAAAARPCGPHAPYRCQRAQKSTCAALHTCVAATGTPMPYGTGSPEGGASTCFDARGRVCAAKVCLPDENSGNTPHRLLSLDLVGC